MTGEFQKALEAFLQALQMDSNHPAALEGREAALEKIEEKEKENRVLDKLKTADNALAMLSFEEAIKIFREVLILAPNNVRAEAGLEKATLALAEQKKIQKLGALIEKGEAALVQEKYASAVVFFDEALAMDPRNQRARNGKNDAEKGMVTITRDRTIRQLTAEADAAFLREEFDTAKNIYKRILELDPGNGPAMAGREKSEIKLDEAEQKRKADALLQQGRAALNSRDFTRANESFNAALSLDSHNQDAAQGKKAAEKGLRILELLARADEKLKKPAIRRGQRDL